MLQHAKALSNAELDKLETLEKAATPGPWEPDEVDCEGSYGSGPNTESGYKAQTMSVPFDRCRPHGNWVVLFDTINSEAAEVQVECDDEGHYAWDEVGRKNFRFIAAIRRAAPALIAMARQAANKNEEPLEKGSSKLQQSR